jgi:hypothetical protein
MNELFQICVDIIKWIANSLGITYEQANIWIFVIIGPLIYLILFLRINYLNNKLNKLKNYGNTGS